jgi:pimeloyl-ACP methyl ester carboxylesterase
MPSIAEFVESAEGAAFFRAYDRVLDKWPTVVETADLSSEHGITRVNTCGAPGSPPLVLLHGGGATSTVWFANVAALAERYRVHAVDLIGDAGRSRAEGTALRTVDDLLDWFDIVVRGIGVETFALAGHSYGAMVALTYALRRPERVSALALLDPTSCFAGMRMPYLAHAAPLLLRPTENRQRRFVEWETGGRPLDEDWLDLLARGAAHFPCTKLVVPKRPTSRQLVDLDVRTTVILAGAGRAHDSGRLAAVVRDRYPRIIVVTIGDATHHTLPMSPHGEVDAALIGALD